MCFFRKRKNKNNEGNLPSGTTANYVPQKNNESDLMEVDWDKIDDQYREVSLPPQHQVNQQYVGSNDQKHKDYYTSSSIITSSPNNANSSVDFAGGNSKLSSPSNAYASVVGVNDAPRSNTISPDASSQFKPDSTRYDYPPETPTSPTPTAFSTPAVVPDAAPPMVMRSVKPDIGGH